MAGRRVDRLRVAGGRAQESGPGCIDRRDAPAFLRGSACRSPCGRWHPDSGPFLQRQGRFVFYRRVVEIVRELPSEKIIRGSHERSSWTVVQLREFSPFTSSRARRLGRGGGGCRLARIHGAATTMDALENVFSAGKPELPIGPWSNTNVKKRLTL